MESSASLTFQQWWNCTKGVRLHVCMYVQLENMLLERYSSLLPTGVLCNLKWRLSKRTTDVFLCLVAKETWHTTCVVYSRFLNPAGNILTHTGSHDMLNRTMRPDCKIGGHLHWRSPPVFQPHKGGIVRQHYVGTIAEEVCRNGCFPSYDAVGM